MIRLLLSTVAIALLAGCSTPAMIEANDAPPVKTVGSVPLHRLWSASVGATNTRTLRLGPSVSQGRLFAADAEGTVTALDAKTGKRIWQQDLERPLSGGPASGDGLVVIGTREGAVLGMKADSGKLEWESGVTSEVLAPAAIGQGTVVVRTNDGRVFALEEASGERRWLYDRNVPSLSLRGHSSPVLVQDGAIVGFDNGRLTALTLEDGTPAWDATVGLSKGKTDLERMVDIDADPVVAGDRVFAASYQSRIASVRLRDGQIEWTRDISSYSGLAVDRGNVYVTDDKGRVWALDRSSGASVWRQDELSGLALTAPVRFGDYLAFGASDGYVYFLAKDTGAIVDRRSLDDTRVLVRPLVSGDRMYVQSGGGRLVAWRLGKADGSS
ncbi:MAG TPA: outer membrane protein assembly factor BamB [Gammaproteobacteria bacterium]|nr:outer membrane protein assembly factor BamB [Gammaproteobacteria bacterium]